MTRKRKGIRDENKLVLVVGIGVGVGVGVGVGSWSWGWIPILSSSSEECSQCMKHVYCRTDIKDGRY
jgi:hypothetical protein